MLLVTRVKWNRENKIVTNTTIVWYQKFIKVQQYHLWKINKKGVPDKKVIDTIVIKRL